VTPLTAYVGLGANLDEPAARLRAVMDEMRPQRRSSLYRTAPVGHAAQPDYVNAVIAIETDVPAAELLASLLATESRHGRVRSFANAPRRLDLDLLLYGNEIIAGPGLEVPHPRMHERRFVLEPLCEIAPDCVIPGRGPAREWLARAMAQPVQRLGP
jgi:2-amino-4-hydroxy-6-hydroxymethyldihydropteridine diphosphokinase